MKNRHCFTKFGKSQPIIDPSPTNHSLGSFATGQPNHQTHAKSGAEVLGQKQLGEIAVREEQLGAPVGEERRSVLSTEMVNEVNLTALANFAEFVANAGRAHPASANHPLLYYATQDFLIDKDVAFGDSVCEGSAVLNDVRIRSAPPITRPDGSFSLYWECGNGLECCAEENDCCAPRGPVFSHWALLGVVVAVLLAVFGVVWRLWKKKVISGKVATNASVHYKARKKSRKNERNFRRPEEGEATAAQVPGTKVEVGGRSLTLVDEEEEPGTSKSTEHHVRFERSRTASGRSTDRHSSAKPHYPVVRTSSGKTPPPRRAKRMSIVELEKALEKSMQPRRQSGIRGPLPPITKGAR